MLKHARNVRNFKRCLKDVRIFPHKDRIEYSVIMREDIGHRMPAFRHILCSEYFATRVPTHLQ